MSYLSTRYANVDDFLDLLGLSDSQKREISEEQHNRYSHWVLEGQNNTEAAIADISDDISITPNTPAFTFAKNAVINWALYKKRAKDGSQTKDDAKEDFKMNIEFLRNVITKERSDRVKAVIIEGPTRKNPNILLPSQLDTQFYGSS